MGKFGIRLHYCTCVRIIPFVDRLFVLFINIVLTLLLPEVSMCMRNIMSVHFETLKIYFNF